MIEKLNIKVFCLNQDLCNLLKKYFDKSNYLCLCIKLGIDSFNLSGDINNNEIIDCIIIDDTINSEHKRLIIEKYNDIPVLHIPALMDVNDRFDKDKAYISEPFKISELDKNLRELYEKKIQK